MNRIWSDMSLNLLIDSTAVDTTAVLKFSMEKFLIIIAHNMTFSLCLTSAYFYQPFQHWSHKESKVNKNWKFNVTESVVVRYHLNIFRMRYLMCMAIWY